jgi:hypothetical protein
MMKRTAQLAVAHVLAVTGFAFFAGVFSGRSGVIQFFGHLGPAMLFASAGLISISRKIDTRRLIRLEAYLALGAASVYVLVDSFIIHPPFGIFDGAGTAEQQHVALNLMLIALASFVLVTLRYTEVLPSIQILIAAAAFAVVFSEHGQHSAVSMVGHNATIVFVVLAAVLRLLDRMFEYGVILLIAAHTFFSSQMGLARFAEEVGIDPATWSAYWITAAALAAAAYLRAMRQQPRQNP